MTATKVTLLAEKYYAKLWMGEGAPSASFQDPFAKTKTYTPEEISSGYEAYTSTDDYVGKYVVPRRPNADIGTFYEVSSENKDQLSIVPGTTPAYQAQDLRSKIDASGFSSTADYVGYFVLIIPSPGYGSFVIVTDDEIEGGVVVNKGNKNDLGIIPGLTVAYTSPILETVTPAEMTPALGWFYVNITTGDFYIYTGGATPWVSSGKWTGSFL